MNESLIDYTIARVGPSILGGSIVGCMIEGEVTVLHIGLIGSGIGLIVLGWFRQRAVAAA